METVTVRESVIQPLAWERLHDAYHQKRCGDAAVAAPASRPA